MLDKETIEHKKKFFHNFLCILIFNGLTACSLYGSNNVKEVSTLLFGVTVKCLLISLAHELIPKLIYMCFIFLDI